MIKIASLLFNIDDNLLTPETVSCLSPWLVSQSKVCGNSIFNVVLSDDGAFLRNFSPTFKLKTYCYQESESSITAVYRFSTFRIHINEKRMELYPFNKRYFDELHLISDLKFLLSIIILEKGGLLLHSSSVYRNDCALLFTGKSGAGKSTIAQLLTPEWGVLNDEFNIVVPENGMVSVYPTPFGITINTQKTASQLRYIFLLKKSITNRVESLSDSSVMLCILRNVCTFPINDCFGHKLFENADLVRRKVSVKKLVFSKSKTVLDFIEKMDTI